MMPDKLACEHDDCTTTKQGDVGHPNPGFPGIISVCDNCGYQIVGTTTTMKQFFKSIPGSVLFAQK